MSGKPSWLYTEQEIVPTGNEIDAHIESLASTVYCYPS